MSERFDPLSVALVADGRSFEACAVDGYDPFPIALRVVEKSSDRDSGWSMTLAEAARLHAQLGEAIEKVQQAA